MAKAVLVMDMSETCKDCSCKYPSYKDDALYDCAITGKTIPIDGGHYGEKPDWCPLRELPERKERRVGEHGERMFRAGFNSCLGEILKGRKE